MILILLEVKFVCSKEQDSFIDSIGRDIFMKKQILTLTLCLALTATSALAATTTPVAKAPVKPATCACAKPVAKAAVKVVKPAAPAEVKAPEVVLTPEQLAKKNTEEKLAKDRECLLAKLGVSAEQKAKAEPLLAKVQVEKAKLRELKAKKACPVLICKQKAEVKKAKKAFEATLNKDQVAKLKSLKKSKCACKCHDHKAAPEAMAAPKCPCEKK